MTRWLLDPAASQVWIEGSSSVHPIRARAAGLTGWVQLSARGGKVAATPGLLGEVRIAVDRLQSGNPLVDRETRRRIDAGRFPEIVGTATGAERTAPGQLSVTGRIDFRGESRDVSGELTVSIDGDRLTIEGGQTFDVRDWGLQPPKVALLRVHPDIQVRIHLEARKGTDS
jgi:polyisoprenoid-binding protein YceI